VSRDPQDLEALSAARTKTLRWLVGGEGAAGISRTLDCRPERGVSKKSTPVPLLHISFSRTLLSDPPAHAGWAPGLRGPQTGGAVHQPRSSSDGLHNNELSGIGRMTGQSTQTSLMARTPCEPPRSAPQYRSAHPYRRVQDDRGTRMTDREIQKDVIEDGQAHEAEDRGHWRKRFNRF